MNDASAQLIDQLHAVLGKVELVLGVIDEAIGWVNEEGLIKWCNRSFDQLVGHPHIYIIGERCSDLLPLEQENQPVSSQKHPINRVLLESQPRVEGFYEFQQAQTRRLLEVVAIRVHFGQRPAAAAFVIRDITRRQKAEESLLERTTQLEAANQELEAFSYSVSHDLRTPLRAIAGFASLLTDEHAGQLDGDGQHCLEVIRTSVKQMGQLIDDLLAFSRLGRQPLGRTQVDMPTLVKVVMEELRFANPERQIQTTIHPLPAAYGDKALLHEVLMNLVSNAIKFAKPKEPAFVEIGAQKIDGEIVYYVKDKGVGFDMRYADKLFGVFQRLHRPEEFEGTGVGLALAQRIIHRHGGRVWAEGQVDQGATFYFTLPKGEGSS